MHVPLNGGWWGERPERRSSVVETGLALPAARAALLAHFGATDAPSGETQRSRAAVRELCDDAHRQQLQPEQLLIAIKGAWHSIPESRSSTRPGSTQDSLDRFISLCIEEYYARRD
jgi:hypothetical protein